MIDEELTWKFYGYHSDELSRGSNKPIVARCDKCCQYRVLQYIQYRDMCVPCTRVDKNVCQKISETMKNRIITDEQRKRLCTNKGKIFGDDTRKKMSESHKGVKRPPFTEDHRNNIGKSREGVQHTEESCRKMSATRQSIPYEEWNGFVSNGAYCEKFDEACRERIRAKYDHRCFVCDRPQDENITKNGKQIKLSVHHVDKNKNQGCDGVLWKLIPLCMRCHPGSHYEPLKSRIAYICQS